MPCCCLIRQAGTCRIPWSSRQTSPCCRCQPNVRTPDHVRGRPRITSGADPNPVGNIAQFMRNNWLSNRIFTDHSDITDHCCNAWNRLTDSPSRSISTGMRAWVHGW